jgi:hypothetical protein
MNMHEFRQRFEVSVTFRRQALFSALKQVSDMHLLDQGAGYSPHNDMAFYAFYLQFQDHSNKHMAHGLYQTFLRPWLNHDGGEVVMGEARQALQPNPHYADAAHAHFDERGTLVQMHRTQVQAKLAQGDAIKAKWRKRPLIGTAVIKLSSRRRKITNMSAVYDRAVQLLFDENGSIAMFLANPQTDFVDSSWYPVIAQRQDVAPWLDRVGNLESPEFGGFDLAYAGLTLQ